MLFLIIMGLPVLTMELAVGRASKASVVQAYEKLEPKNSFWHIHLPAWLRDADDVLHNSMWMDDCVLC